MRSTTILALSLTAAAASAQTTANFDQPTFDRWNYPFGPGGDRETISTFYPGFTPGLFDDRDAQALVSYVTAGNFAPGQGAENYVITGARVVATIATDSAFAYDPTADSFRSTLLPSDPRFTPDTDAGLPIELYGTGFNAGLNAFAYGEDFNWGAGGPTQEDVRFAFAADFDGSGNLRNVSNNVRDGFETNPFAVGQASVTPGDLVASGTEFAFDLDVNNPAIAGYLADGLDLGILSFSLSSLHPAAQGGAVEFPDFWSKESPDGPAIRFEITAEVIPAPMTAGVLGLGLLGAARRRRSSTR
ncbi:MAG: hypothetical protein AAF138_03310 [Planctomycetota bacterium]